MTATATAIEKELQTRERFVRDAVLEASAVTTEADVGWLGDVALASHWALAPRTLSFLARLVSVLKPAHVLELGSGTSTRVLARALAALGEGSRLTSFDNDPAFAASTRKALAGDGTAAVASVRFVPLVARSCFGTLAPVYEWERRTFAVEAPVDLVLIDGPPRALGGRLGTLYQALRVARPGALVLLDDAERPEEAEVLEKWRADLGDAIATESLPGFDRGLAAVFVRDPAVVTRHRSPSDVWYLAHADAGRRRHA